VIQRSVIQETAVNYSITPLNGASGKVLLADDDSQNRHMIRTHLEDAGYAVIEAADGDRALELLREDVAAVVVSLELPGTSGFDVLRDVRARFPDTPVIMTAQRVRTPDAVEAMRVGAFRFLAKPFHPEELLSVVRHAVRAAALERDNDSLREAVRTPLPAPTMVARSPAMRELRQQVERAAALDATALITGETGTGKSTLARMIHQLGPRAAGPFITVSCASLPRDLFETELFGHERGAFAGAASARPGRIEMAEGGTLFLDDIEDLPLELQPKLLAFLRERMTQRIGSKRAKHVDVRVIAATHLDLEQMVRENRFREDLYFRLNVVRLDTPKLADRQRDLPELVDHILRRIGLERGGMEFSLTPGAELRLAAHPWRGNLRELENVLERATASSRDQHIDVDLLELDSTPGSRLHGAADRPHLAGFTMEQIERWALLDTLETLGGNKAAAARALGVCEKTVYNKLKRMHLQERHA